MRAERATEYHRIGAFFVPKLARWPYLRDELHRDVGNGLNAALGELEDANPALDGVLRHIDFNRRVGQTRLSDQRLRDLIRHFSKHRLCNEDFEFLNISKAAQVLGINQHTLRSWCKRGKVPFRKMGRNYQISRRVVNELMMELQERYMVEGSPGRPWADEDFSDLIEEI